ncbi:hypothetical protein QYM36_014634, partial [Artemia franciscana]
LKLGFDCLDFKNISPIPCLCTPSFLPEQQNSISPSYHGPPCPKSMPLEPVSDAETARIVNDSRGSSPSGPDRIPIKVVKFILSIKVSALVKCGKQGPVTGPGSSIVPPHFRTKIDIRRQKMASSAVKPPVLPDSRTIRNESKNFQPINIQPFTMMQRCKSTGVNRHHHNKGCFQQYVAKIINIGLIRPKIFIKRNLTEATGMRASSEELPVYENKYPSAPATNSEIQSFEVEK